jgi:hypothetical protein
MGDAPTASLTCGSSRAERRTSEKTRLAFERDPVEGITLSTVSERNVTNLKVGDDKR